MLSDKLITLANNTEKVFNAGYNKALKENPPGATEEELEEKYNEGYNNGYNEGRDIWYPNGLSQGRAEGRELGISEGRQAEYDAFWDAFQSKGTRVSYACGFGGSGWSNTLFKPKYDICPTDSYMMFRSTGITDLKNIPVKLDFSNSTNTQYMFQWAEVKYIGELDVRKVRYSLSSNMFSYASIVSIDLLKIGADNSYSGWFTGCSTLVSIAIDGEICRDSFDISPCTKLNKASIESIINALSNEKSGLTVTLSKTAVNREFGINVDDPTTYPEGSEYYALRQSKSNWTISYA